MLAAFFYSKFNLKSIKILIFPAFGNLCFKANSNIYIYICILNFYTYFIEFGKKADGGGVLTVRFRIYIYDLVSIQHLDGAPA